MTDIRVHTIVSVILQSQGKDIPLPKLPIARINLGKKDDGYLASKTNSQPVPAIFFLP